MSNGLEVKAGPVEGKAYGQTVIMTVAAIGIIAGVLYQGHLLRQEIQNQTAHFNGRVDSILHEVERTCQRL